MTTTYRIRAPYLHSRRAYPGLIGDSRRQLLTTLWTMDGDEIPAGTVYQPLSAGADALRADGDVVHIIGVIDDAREGR